ncbi:conserved hypothetical protein [Catenulispora acidiphila DSM 44928]|uniref:Lysine exporter protein (LYSE/YGGA) n=1 Tax=Catenulispora acidiphila (strain DSM 44928 / JCM 14897 / NBRC 102108 / NRRL B-24433 / ID139908) TaxID=479433 RepID=C7PYB4_CATAD|nr:GAP family protein [Catenulispora acidiphila]ACU75404.1 conserved hypothetical protein [Catenulispora acidiphila DSM 44928]
MGAAIGAMLGSAVGVAISPLPLIAMVLLLATPRGRADGLAFCAGWLLSLTLVGTVMLLIGAGEDADEGSAPATWVSWLTLVLGVLFAFLAVGQWKARPRPGRPARTPGWMAGLDRTTPARAAGLGALLSGANPKNLALTVGAAAGIAGATSQPGARAVALVLFVLIGSLCVLVPLGVYLAGGKKAAATLEGWKDWMATHNAAIMTTVLAVLAAKYVGDALANL